MIARAGQRLLVAGAIAGFAAAIGLQVMRDRLYPREEQLRTNVLYVRSGPALARLALEYDALLADVYWIRAIQHYGGEALKARTTARSFDLLYPLLDITTTLDPAFKIAYRFGAIFLSEPPPKGPGRSDLAIKLLEKAIAQQPGKWQYYHDVAFVYYWHRGDYRSAADWFTRASQQPEAPNWLPAVSASMLTQANDRASARFLWNQLRSSDQPWLRTTAERNLMQLDTMDVIDQLDQIVRRNAPPAGVPYSWERLVRAGVLRGIPADPSGTPFEIDAVTGQVAVSQQSPLFPMPDRTRAQPK